MPKSMTFNMVYYELPLSILFYFCEFSPKCKKNWGCDIYIYLFIYFVGTRQKKQGFWIGFRRSTLTSCQMVARIFFNVLSYMSRCYLMLNLSWDASQWYDIKKNWKKIPTTSMQRTKRAMSVNKWIKTKLLFCMT